MAFLDPKNLGQNASDVDVQAAPTISAGGAGDVGGAGVSTAGIGAGGTGGWTNIQAYLNANQGGTGSANMLSNQVGNQFSNEKSQLEGGSQQALSNAQKSVDDNKITNDQADQYINTAAQNYDYGGNQNQAYQDTKSKFQNSLNNQWSMPTDYSYAFGANTQSYGNAMSDNNAFSGLMGNLYSQAAGGQLTSGQSNLQSQLDVNNQALSDARNNLAGQYGDLQKERDQVNKDTTSKLGDYQTQYGGNQSALQSYLGKKEGDYDTQVSKAQNDARTGYQTDLNSQSGHANALWGPLNSYSQQTGIGFVPGNLQNAGLWSGNLTNAQLQQEQDIANDPTKAGNAWYSGNPLNMQSNLRAIEGNNLSANHDYLNQFNTSEDQKYSNAGDQQKRAFNSIADFLGQTGNQKQQGFNFRG